MKASETAATYDRIGHHWDGPGFNRQNGISQHERALRFARATGAALDVGCGCSGRILDLLLAKGFAVEGLDISGETLRLARRRHPQLVFHQADMVGWELPHAYDFISAWDSLWHVPLDLQTKVLGKLCAGLNPGGILIFTTGAVAVPGEVTNPCHGEPLYHAAPGVPVVLQAIADAGCVLRHFEHDQHPELHVYLVVEKG